MIDEGVLQLYIISVARDSAEEVDIGMLPLSFRIERNNTRRFRREQRCCINSIEL
jgi:hypothetical protein